MTWGPGLPRVWDAQCTAGEALRGHPEHPESASIRISPSGVGPGTRFIRLHRHKGGDPERDSLQREAWVRPDESASRERRPRAARSTGPRWGPGPRQDETRGSGLWAFSGHQEEGLCQLNAEGFSLDLHRCVRFYCNRLARTHCSQGGCVS